LLTITDLDEVMPNEFLAPFLAVIRSEETTGPITGLALTSVNKFLSYGLVGEFICCVCCDSQLLEIQTWLGG